MLPLTLLLRAASAERAEKPSESPRRLCPLRRRHLCRVLAPPRRVAIPVCILALRFVKRLGTSILVVGTEGIRFWVVDAHRTVLCETDLRALVFQRRFAKGLRALGVFTLCLGPEVA